MLVQFVFCAVGLVILTGAADHLVRGSSRLAARLRVNPVVVGVVVIGLGTSAPEFLVSGSAAARGDTGIAVGNITGSNILNLTLVLGIAALIAALGVEASVIAREVRLTVAAIVVFAACAWIGLNSITGALLALLLAVALAILIRWAHTGRNLALAVDVAEFTDTEPGPEADDSRVHRVWLESVRALIGLGGVLLGAQLLVTNASAIAARFSVPQVVIGFTLVALGTSLPELVTTIQAQRRGETDLVVGNLFGSNLFNSLGGGAIVGLASGMSHPAKASVVVVVPMILTALLAWALLRRGLRLSRPEGALLVAAYLFTFPLVLSG